MTPPAQSLPLPTSWYCVRTRPKQELIAARSLGRLGNIRVFHPRLRYRRLQGARTAWVTESLFPNYLFARFDLPSQLRAVRYASGVSTIVHFGDHWPILAPETIDDLEQWVGANSIHTLTTLPCPGEPVTIAGGALRGLSAVVQEVLPARERVRLLLDFLGRQNTVELDVREILREHRRALAPPP